VKLHQFDPTDMEQKVIDTRGMAVRGADASGVEVHVLHDVPTERVSLERWHPGADAAEADHSGGQEVFVLEGVWEDDHGRYPAGTWIRNPPGFRHKARSSEGCLLYVKTGHLAALAVV
jgi:anti-sigma factor ChrR (cupin superfamily)